VELSRRDGLFCLAVAALLAPALSLALVLPLGWEAWGSTLRWALLAGVAVSLVITLLACLWRRASRMEAIMLSAFGVLCGGGAVGLAYAVALGESIN